MARGSILLDALRRPDRALELSEPEWNALIRQANHHVVLGRLGVQLDELGLTQALPDRARRQIQDARVTADFNQAQLRFEVNRVQRALIDQVGPMILLKGAAYVAAGLPLFRGRLAGDLDILVPQAQLLLVREALLAAGWRSLARTDYDEHYYRTWMHELAPLEHPEREMVTDVHHTIAPPTSRVSPDVSVLWADAIDVGPGLKVLAPEDMVLHAAVHLFNEDLQNGFRDLLDLNDMLAQFGEEETFWHRLEGRAERHGLGRVLHYALLSTSAILGTAIPTDTLDRVRRGHAPSAPVGSLMIALITAALTPRDPAQRSWPTQTALGFFYLRSHWLRMPPLMLLRHLSIKAWFKARDAILPTPATPGPTER